jgi:hypothetical protein
MTIVMQGLSTKYNCIYFALERLPSFLKGEHLLATMMKETWLPNYFASVSKLSILDDHFWLLWGTCIIYEPQTMWFQMFQCKYEVAKGMYYI